jgi:hypothetical protein
MGFIGFDELLEVSFTPVLISFLLEDLFFFNLLVRERFSCEKDYFVECS